MRSHKFFIWVAIVFILTFLSASFAREVSAFTLVDADITMNTTWIKAQSPYVVVNDIAVLSEATLTLEPGVVVKFDYGNYLYIQGILNALGTEAELIYFTSRYDDELGEDTDDEEICDIDEEGNSIPGTCVIFDWGDPMPGDWGGIDFDGSIGSQLENVSVRYTDVSYARNFSEINFKNFEIENSIGGINVFNDSQIEILNGTFKNLDRDALVVFSDSLALLENVNISNIEGQAVNVFRSSSIEAKNITFSNIFNQPLNVYFDSSFTADNLKMGENIAPDSGWMDTINVYLRGNLILKNSFFKDCPYGSCIALYDEFGSHSIIDIDNTVFNSGRRNGINIFSDGDFSAKITNSSFENFDFYAIENYADFSVQAENNWWGDSSGPNHESLNPEGQGEAIYGDVDFEPWLESWQVSSCCSNVLFLPGLEASRLYIKRVDSSEDQLWEPNGNSDLEDLYLNSDGTSINPDIYTRDIIKEANLLPFGSVMPNVYKSFAEMLDGLVVEEKINEWKPYAYDWRQSVDDIVENGTKYESGVLSLIETLQSLADSSKSGKVTIVAHSNGGLLAKALLKKLGENKTAGINNLIDKIDVLIQVASPEIGTAQAVPAILHGYDQSFLLGTLMDQIHARELGRNMQSGFGLLPSREYINRVSALPVTFRDSVIPSGVTTDLVNAFGGVLDSYSEYKSFLFGEEGRTNPEPNELNLPIILSQNLFFEAENLHDSIDSWTPSEKLRVIEIAGWGLSTVGSFEYYPKCYPTSISGSTCLMDQEPRFTTDGDGTVVVPSAHYMSVDNSDVEKYWVDINKFNNDLPPLARNRKHDNILEVDQLNNFIKSTVVNEDIVFDDVLKNTEPVNISDWLQLSIHSPVTLDAYDTDGNHTGKICPANSDFCYLEEEITNSSYLEFGEGKYLNLPKDEFYKVKLLGTGIGTFTYESEEIRSDGTSDISYFLDIPVTTQTQGEITINQTTQELELKLDITGDGTSDFIVQPSDSFDPIAYLQIMKATINSLDLPINKKNAFSKKVDRIIKLIQIGKIDRAQLKAEKFRFRMEKRLSQPDPVKPRPKKISKTDAQLLLDMLNKLLDNLN